MPEEWSVKDAMKWYMIHSCNKRKWYVESFLLPSMIEQGIPRENIMLWNDYKSEGNLAMFVKSMKAVSSILPIGESVWHLQDDVMISSDFAAITEECPPKFVCNGFCAFEKSHFGDVGWQTPKNRWLSFQCTQIPVRYSKGFIDWWEYEILAKNREERRRRENKHDDHFFWEFMSEVYENDPIYNIVPNIVQHIDYMLGGSVLGNDTDRRIGKAQYWRENEREERLFEAIKQHQTDKGVWQEQEDQESK